MSKLLFLEGALAGRLIIEGLMGLYTWLAVLKVQKYDGTWERS